MTSIRHAVEGLGERVEEGTTVMQVFPETSYPDSTGTAKRCQFCDDPVKTRETRDGERQGKPLRRYLR